MHKHFIKTPWLVKKLFAHYIWQVPTAANDVYLTFDDGPHPTITPFVLAELKKHQAKATFFCIGKNVLRYPDVYKQIIEEGHAVGNHTHSHVNGWKTPVGAYIADVTEAARHIDTNLFRPPYGRIGKKQARQIPAALQRPDAKIIMWDVLSADFDRTITPEACLNNVVKNTVKGSVIVFHDSEKAFENMRYALPKVLSWMEVKGFKSLPLVY